MQPKPRAETSQLLFQVCVFSFVIVVGVRLNDSGLAGVSRLARGSALVIVLACRDLAQKKVSLLTKAPPTCGRHVPRHGRDCWRRRAQLPHRRSSNGERESG